MLYGKIENGMLIGQAITKTQLEKQFKDSSLPKVLTDESLSSIGYSLIHGCDMAEVPSITENEVLTITTVKRVDNKWVRVYSVEPLPGNNVNTSQRRIRNRIKKLREDRQKIMDSIDWKYNRYHREVRLGLPTTDTLEDLDAKMQRLADITTAENIFDVNLSGEYEHAFKQF